MLKTRIFRMAAISVLAAASALAHHSFSAEFDDKKPVTLKGSVTKVEWTNPHAWVYIDVKDEKGAVAHWQCESGPPNMLVRSGWKKDALKPGDTVTINGFLAKDGTNTMSAHDIVLPDGKKVFSGSAEDVGSRK